MLLLCCKSADVNDATNARSTRPWNASFRFCVCIGTVNLEQVRRHRQGAAGILPAVLFSDWSAGKMPAALWGSWKIVAWFATLNR